MNDDFEDQRRPTSKQRPENERKSFHLFFLFVEPPDSPPHLFFVLVSLEPLSAPSVLILGTNANHLLSCCIESASIIIHFPCSLRLVCLVGILIL